jgi:hypothetical protein
VHADRWRARRGSKNCVGHATLKAASRGPTVPFALANKGAGVHLCRNSPLWQCAAGAGCQKHRLAVAGQELARTRLWFADPLTADRASLRPLSKAATVSAGIWGSEALAAWLGFGTAQVQSWPARFGRVAAGGRQLVPISRTGVDARAIARPRGSQVLGQSGRAQLRPLP